MAARNMCRIEINIYEKGLCVKLVIYKDCTEMHVQQNIKFNIGIFTENCSRKKIFVKISAVTVLLL